MNCERCGYQLDPKIRICFRCGASTTPKRKVADRKPHQEKPSPKHKVKPIPRTRPDPPDKNSRASNSGEKEQATGPKTPSNEPKQHETPDKIPLKMIAGWVFVVSAIILLVSNTPDDPPTIKPNAAGTKQSTESSAPKYRPKPEPLPRVKTPSRKDGLSKSDEYLINPPIKPSSKSPTPRQRFSEEVFDVQTALKRNGYAIATIDGIYGPNTRRAIISFQRNNGMLPDGQVTPEILLALRNQDLKPVEQFTRTIFSIGDLTMVDVARLMGQPDASLIEGDRETWKFGASWVRFNNKILNVLSVRDFGELAFLNPDAKTIDAKTLDSVRSSNYIPKHEYFTRYSHKSNLLAIHGAPQRIQTIRRLNIEKWFFGNNMIVVDKDQGTILRWSTDGSMKARLIPGPNVTRKKLFGVGSHEDDVIRLQQTPKQIQRNYYGGTERWVFDQGWVEIGIHDHIVDVYENHGGLRARKFE